MNITQHWLNQAKKVPSDNFDTRPVEGDISLVVIHCISLPAEQFGGDYIDQLFCNQLCPEDHITFKSIYQLKVSSHLLIKRCGEVTQYVAFNQRAWHAGESGYQGRQQCNDFSIGIELEGADTCGYTSEQYIQLNRVLETLLNYYPRLSKEHITGHSDIAPRRKTDPGAFFDWTQIR
ncbi:MAG: 1,6-anhydro-N-acetylmuramyl-L-alanine amidase AmpD [Methylococcales bacterium]|nr:1,6-anhydro-N-acetylmuramyl-L-alanine amidase AmpD [Methylococcales bacterium]